MVESTSAGRHVFALRGISYLCFYRVGSDGSVKGTRHARFRKYVCNHNWSLQGHDWEDIQNIMAFLGPAASKLRIIGHPRKKLSGQLKNITVEDQLLLFLVKNRENYKWVDLGVRFGIQGRLASQIWHTWLQV